MLALKVANLSIGTYRSPFGRFVPSCKTCSEDLKEVDEDARRHRKMLKSTRRIERLTNADSEGLKGRVANVRCLNALR